ncbi:hypothetical protein SKAU_G00354590 [Synaphobranchus kaupii]|uniref:Uncharacterized protein n=1 Tax=Synaphobranchus kaupii TaxID=118154 RepID=A0A9Q1EH19_SYNKA|nr:hypothetical protein SKAU_G00354590 [Synaphobranchus kaupii]
MLALGRVSSGLRSARDPDPAEGDWGVSQTPPPPRPYCAPWAGPPPSALPGLGFWGGERGGGCSCGGVEDTDLHPSHKSLTNTRKQEAGSDRGSCGHLLRHSRLEESKRKFISNLRRPLPNSSRAWRRTA